MTLCLLSWISFLIKKLTDYLFSQQVLCDPVWRTVQTCYLNYSEICLGRKHSIYCSEQCFLCFIYNSSQKHLVPFWKRINSDLYPGVMAKSTHFVFCIALITLTWFHAKTHPSKAEDKMLWSDPVWYCPDVSNYLCVLFLTSIIWLKPFYLFFIKLINVMEDFCFYMSLKNSMDSNALLGNTLQKLWIYSTYCSFLARALLNVIYNHAVHLIVSSWSAKLSQKQRWRSS